MLQPARDALHGREAGQEHRLRHLHDDDGEQGNRPRRNPEQSDNIHRQGRKEHLQDRPAQRPRAGRPPARGRREIRRADNQADVAAAQHPAELDNPDRHILPHRAVHVEEDDGQKRQLHVLRHGQVERENLREILRGHKVQRRRWRGRGEGKPLRDSRLPARPEQIQGNRRVDAEGHTARWPSGYGQDDAREGRRGRGERALLLDIGLRIRRDVRRHGRREGARPLQAGEGESALHRIHRRNRRDRPAPRRARHGQRRARADAEPAADRDGRLRGQQRRHDTRRDQQARVARPRADAPGQIRPPRPRRAARPQGPRGDTARTREARQDGRQRRLQQNRENVLRRVGRGAREHRQRSGAARGTRRTHGRDRGRYGREHRSRHRGLPEEKRDTDRERAPHRRLSRNRPRDSSRGAERLRPRRKDNDNPAHLGRARLHDAGRGV